MIHKAHLCQAKKREVAQEPWKCNHLDNLVEARNKGYSPHEIVFAIQFPHPGLEMSRWHQFIATSVRLDVQYNKDFPYRAKGNAFTLKIIHCS
jgi:hypothetical protein